VEISELLDGKPLTLNNLQAKVGHAAARCILVAQVLLTITTKEAVYTVTFTLFHRCRVSLSLRSGWNGILQSLP